jgi:hypothetical protein
MKARRRKFGKAEVARWQCRKATCSLGHDLAARSAESEFDGARRFQLRPDTGEQRVVA